MKFRHLATSNIRGNWRQYTAFFFSSVFSVMIFFLYAQFILHPDVVHGKLRAAQYVKKGMIACEYIIVIFSFFFVLYSLSAFLKSRSKEFGLLSLYGMTNGQIRRMVLTETMLIAVAATTVGIGLGLLLSKLFLLSLSELLQMDSPIRFAIVWKAVGLTYAVFLILFLVLSAFTIVRFGSKAVVEQLREGRKPKSLPLYSPGLTALAIGTIGVGYFLAYTSTPLTVILLFFPVIGMVVFGTYFLFSQASVALLSLLRRWRGYYRGTNMLVLSQLTFKLKDNARMLFAVTTLSAVVLSAAGTFYVFFQDFKMKTIDSYPQTLAWYVQGDNAEFYNQVKSYLNEKNISIDREIRLQGFAVHLDQNGDGQTDNGALVIPESQYNAQKGRADRVDVQPGQALFLYPPAYDQMLNGFWSIPDGGTVKAGFERRKPAEAMAWTVAGAKKEMLHTATSINTGWLVIDDADYDRKAKEAGSEYIYTVYGLELKNWKQLRTLDDELSRELFDPADLNFYSRIGPYFETTQTSSLTLFLGIFICVLFFIAAGSMIYFKMFTELQSEREMYRALSKIGLTEGEMRRIVGRQLRLIFFVPFIAGAVHAAFAMKALANLLMSNIWMYALTVTAIFFVMQTVYYVLAKRMYVREILKGTR